MTRGRGSAITLAVLAAGFMTPAVLCAQDSAAFLGYHTTVPAGWTSRAPSSNGSPVHEFITRDSTGAFPITVAE